jgi:NADH-quinone oxidoreductase subunit N
MTALLILFLTAIAALFVGLLERREALQPIILLGVAAALGATLFDLSKGGGGWNDAYPTMFQFDTYALSFTGVALVSTLLLVGLTGFGFRQLRDTLGDNYALVLFSLCGALCMFSFTNLVMLFLGIEILSIPLYVLAGSRRDDLQSNEAALKYFLMGSFATGILLFGMTLIYGATGTFDTAAIGRAISEGTSSAGMMKVGILLILIGMSFKVSAVPFHFWAPDVYQGSPNLVTAFMATVVKTAGFAAFYRLFSTSFVGLSEFWSIGIGAIAAITMTLPNLTAIFQTDFKRMMAYSSIAHAGYLMLAILVAGQPGAAGAILLYALTYSIATICAFAVYILVAEQNQDSSFEAFNGLSKKQPTLALVMAVSMLSLAGIPPLAGFFGKYFLFTAAMPQYPWLIVLAVINSAISIYYYFKVIVAMYFSKEENAYSVNIPTGVRVVMLAGIALIVLLTLLPGSVFSMIGK